MNIKQIRDTLKSSKAKHIDDDTKFSILVPLIEINNELNLIFEVRSMSIKRQPGEISFPGGRIEDDESPLEAAIRETYEEIGIKEENIEVITELDYASRISGSFVYSFLGYIKNIDYLNIIFNKDEVSELFYVPLSFFMENYPQMHYVNYYVEADEGFPFHMINDGVNYNWGSIKSPVYFYNYNNYIIWGLTAKITYSLIKKLTSDDIIFNNNL